MIKSFIRFILTLIFVGLLAIAAGFWWSQKPLSLAAPVEFAVKSGSGANAVGRAAAAAGVPLHPPLFALLARVTGRAGNLKAGVYAVNADISPWQLLDKIARGDVLQFSLVVLEGWTFRQMRAALATNPNLTPTVTALPDRAILQAIGASERHPEGLFFPDTYVFSRGTPDIEVFKRAYLSQQQRLAAAWQTRSPDVPLKTPYEALILASIVEKETGRADDRAKIASVFINRLRIGMPLQTDPTVIYGMGASFDGNLRKYHLTTDTAYNTYMRGGLPPTPIALPGAAALAAVLQPPSGSALYFVARGDGTSVFSDNLDDHNRAVNQYQRGQR